MRDGRADYEQLCLTEIRNLKRINQLMSPHLIELLFAYTLRDHYYLVFHWADGNLDRFWQHYNQPNQPERDQRTTKWLFGQCRGLIEGLHVVHETSIHSNPDQSGAKTDPRLFGIHGDLKPENILWFRHENEPYGEGGLGKFKISDFGGTQFHRKQSRSNADPTGSHTTQTYEAPELRQTWSLSRKYDVWCLGCVLLEIVTWYLQGHDEIEVFTEDYVKFDFLQHYQQQKREEEILKQCISGMNDTFFYECWSAGDDDSFIMAKYCVAKVR